MFSCLQNADAVQSGQLTPEEIGVRAVSSTVLQFSLSRPDAEFSAISLPLPPCHAAKPFSSRPKGRYGLDKDSVASCGAFYLRLWFYDPYGNQNQIFMRRNSVNAEARRVYPTNLTFQIRKSNNETAAEFFQRHSRPVYQPRLSGTIYGEQQLCRHRQPCHYTGADL